MAFALYSTDIAPTLNPGGASPAPATLILWDQDPIFGEYDTEAGETGRGSVIRTLGGVVIQDFGVVPGDERIRIAERDALSWETVSSLRNAHGQADVDWFFTDGKNCWKVRFARPNGFKSWRNLLWAAHGREVYSYEMTLVVVSKEI